ncbi:Predicted arabinose efflux permease, MFS family [Mucilaginibacter mallensis]|uniref:Predicted arabinose efflux permease, MFS family n=1 Tax=Mucilaginibacter mallensis TaxID=652787 RepID=A0A1H1T7V5_MUCMA|nr:MFS transporter [Mucilaginibacter mallensis]SDS56066.1 Predicted arabinose efflux permease, MFS family [Mucilaginibacter mallensis]
MNTDKIISTFRAFRSRNYSLFFAGQSISQIGTWMQRTGVSWMVYTMTHSAFMLGLTVFASQFPSFLFSLLGGIASDRYNRYKVLLITQTASMIQAVLLAVLVLINHYTVWEILALSVVLGIVNAFDVPARQPLIHEMVTDKADLPNALALNSSMVNIARLVGPALSGIILVKYGAGACFLINAISFIAVIISLLLMKLPAYIPPSITKKVGSELVEGFVYLKNTPSISVMMLMLGLISLLILPYNTLLPVFAKVIFKGDAATFGYINSFIGLGAVAGSVFLASLKPNADLKIVLLINSIIFGICLIFFSHISYFPLAMLFAALSGFGMMSQTTIFITIIQVESDKAMRGRVMSYVAMAYFGMLPIGSLLIGAISQQIGAPNAILCQGIISLIIVAAFYKFLTSGRRGRANAEQLKEAEEMEIEQV